MACPKSPENFFLSLKDQKKLYDIVYDLQNLFEEHGIVFWAFEGTLLGAFRHNGLIPWDDDIDMAVKISQREKILNIPKKDWTKHNLVLGKHWLGFKVFRPSGKWVPNTEKKFRYRYPFVDVFIMKKYGKKWQFVKDDKSSAWHGDAYSTWPDTYITHSNLFPLTTHKFDFHQGNRRLPVPHNSKPFLDRSYKGWEDVAYTNAWDHKTEEFVDNVCKYKMDDVLTTEREFFNNSTGLLKDNENAKFLRSYVDHVYIINLKHRADRRENVRRNLEYLGFEKSKYTFVNATDRTWKSQKKGFQEIGITSEYLPKTLLNKHGELHDDDSPDGRLTENIIERDGLIEWRISDRGERSKGLAEVAVTLSHARIWKKVMNSKNPKKRILIMEDDACVSSTFAKSDFKELILRAGEKYPEKELVLLGYCYANKTKRIPGLKSSHNFLETGKYYCMQSYIVTPAVASKMMKEIIPISEPVDDLFQRKRIMKDALVFHVPLIHQSSEAGAVSDIREDNSGDLGDTDSMKFGTCYTE